MLIVLIVTVLDIASINPSPAIVNYKKCDYRNYRMTDQESWYFFVVNNKKTYPGPAPRPIDIN